MAQKVSVPFTNENVDPSDPADLTWTVALLIGGFVVMLFSFGVAQDLTEWISDQLSNILGTNVASGEVNVGTNGGGL